MSLKKVSKTLTFLAIPAIAGFLFASQAASDQNNSEPISPNAAPSIIVPGDNTTGALSIIPTDDGQLKLEYRHILFGFGKDKSKDKDMADQNKTSSQGMSGDINSNKGMGSSSQGNTPSMMDRDKGKNLGTEQGSSGSMNQQHGSSNMGTGNSNMGTDNSQKDQGSKSIDTTRSGFHYIVWPFSSDKDKSRSSDLGTHNTDKGNLNNNDMNNNSQNSRDMDKGSSSNSDLNRSNGNVGNTPDTNKKNDFRYISFEPAGTQNRVILTAGVGGSSGTGAASSGSMGSAGMSPSTGIGESGNTGVGTGTSNNMGTNPNGEIPGTPDSDMGNPGMPGGVNSGSTNSMGPGGGMEPGTAGK